MELGITITIVQVYCISHTVHIQYMFMFKRKYWSEPKRHTEKGTHDTEKDTEKDIEQPQQAN